MGLRRTSFAARSARYPHGTTARRTLASCALIGLTYVVSSTPLPLAAQERAPNVDQFTVDDGLAQNLVNAVVQDRAGFIWVATDRGLQRFDGYSFVHLSTLNRNVPAALSGAIRRLQLDSRGRLWISTLGALFKLHPDSLNVTSVLLSPHSDAWAPDSLGHVWMLARGRRLMQIDATVTPARTRAIELRGAAPNVLATSRSGVLWLAGRSRGRGEVIRFDPASNATTTYALESIKAPIAMLEDAASRLWVAGIGGLEVLDRGARRFRTVGDLRGTHVNAIAVVTTGGVLACPLGSLVRVDDAGHVTDRWEVPQAFGSGFMPSYLGIDREGGVWIPSLMAGLFRLDRSRPAFTHVSSSSTPSLPLTTDFVTALTERSDGTFWIGTMQGGAYHVSADGQRVETFRRNPRDPASLAHDLVWDFEVDLAGNLWLGTGNGLCTAAPNGFHCYRKGPAFEVSDIARDTEGWLWLHWYKGNALMSFDPRTRRFGPSMRTVDLVLTVFADRDSSYLWIGGSSLSRARIAAGKLLEPLQHIDATVSVDAPIYDFHRDARGVLWIASYRGLQRWDDGARRFTPVDVPELRNTTVFSLEEDADGRLWLGTAHGLVRYSPATGIARRYRRQDGVMSGEFNRRAALRRRDGEMLFGGVNGLTRFHPEVVTRRRAAPPIVFTGWRKATSNGIVDAAIDGGTRLRLGPGDRAFSLDFAALSFASGPVRRYRYRLEGLSDDWIESSDHLVTYSTPSPGRYTFRVEAAAGAEGEWHSPGATIALQVVPPFWGTTWFRTLVLALAIASLWFLHRLRLRRALATERLRNRISRDLHDEIGAGLSSIALLSDSVGSTGRITERDRTQLDRIARSARSMVANLRDIVWAIDPDADTLQDVVARMKDVANTLLHDVSLTFHTPRAEALTDKIGMAARRDLLLVFKELLHNVSRHAHARTVLIEFDARDDELHLVVADDGVGFDPNDARSGIGLKSLRERTARLGGRLEFSNGGGGGTTARLTLRKT